MYTQFSPVADSIAHVDCRDPPISLFISGREGQGAELESDVLKTVGRLGEIGKEPDSSESV